MTPDDELGVVVAAAGETIDFEIENRHHAEVWVSLVELAADHSITVMMPRRGHQSFRRGGYRLGPGEVTRVGRDYYAAEGGLEQVLPEGFPWAAGSAPGSEDVAVADLKLLVTTVPADFEFVEQEKARVVASHPLRKLALLYHSGAGTRRVILPAEDVAADQDWTALSRALGVRRRPADG